MVRPNAVTLGVDTDRVVNALGRSDGDRSLRLSVAMCTFDGERYLESQLASVLSQTRAPDKVVVCDDGSSDRTVAILKDFAATAPFPVEVLESRERLGVTRNFERAVQSCSGDIIVLGDQDDRWLPERLERLETLFRESPHAGMAFSDAWLIDETGRRTGERLWDIAGFNRRQRRRMGRDGFATLMGRSIASGCTMAFRADLKPVVLPFPEERTDSTMRVLHDRWISLAIGAVASVAVIDEPLLEYRLHPAQQVGIPALQIRRRVPSSLLRWRSAAVPTREHVARLAATVSLLHIVAQRVEDHVVSPQREEALACVHDAAAHLSARASLPPLHMRRVFGVLKEASTLRYHRYSLGVASAVADLVRPRT